MEDGKLGYALDEVSFQQLGTIQSLEWEFDCYPCMLRKCNRLFCDLCESETEWFRSERNKKRWKHCKCTISNLGLILGSYIVAVEQNLNRADGRPPTSSINHNPSEGEYSSATHTDTHTHTQYYIAIPVIRSARNPALLLNSAKSNVRRMKDETKSNMTQTHSLWQAQRRRAKRLWLTFARSQLFRISH